MRKFRKGQACRVKLTEKIRASYFAKKYGTETPNVEVVGTVPERYGADWRSRFLYIPECYAYLNHTKFALTDQTIVARVVGVKGRKSGDEILHPSELVRTRKKAVR